MPSSWESMAKTDSDASFWLVRSSGVPLRAARSSRDRIRADAWANPHTPAINLHNGKLRGPQVKKGSPTARCTSSFRWPDC